MRIVNPNISCQNINSTWKIVLLWDTDSSSNAWNRMRIFSLPKRSIYLKIYILISDRCCTNLESLSTDAPAKKEMVCDTVFLWPISERHLILFLSLSISLYEILRYEILIDQGGFPESNNYERVCWKNWIDSLYIFCFVSSVLLMLYKIIVYNKYRVFMY